MDTAIKKAYEKIEYVSMDKELWHAYRMREMALSDYTSGMNAAEKRGIAIGKEKGIAIGKERGIARGEQKSKAIFIMNLKLNGVPIEQISKYVSLAEEEVVKIFEEQGLK
jgi:hypothetical protein